MSLDDSIDTEYLTLDWDYKYMTRILKNRKLIERVLDSSLAPNELIRLYIGHNGVNVIGKIDKNILNTTSKMSLIGLRCICHDDPFRLWHDIARMEADKPHSRIWARKIYADNKIADKKEIVVLNPIALMDYLESDQMKKLRRNKE